MKPRSHLFAVSCPLVLVGAVWLSGCSRPAVPLKLTGRAVTWTEGPEDARKPGLTEATVWYAVTEDGQRDIVVWVDLGRDGAQKYGETSGSAHLEGVGRRIKWEAVAVRDGKLSVTINGTTYDAANGRLFLVSTMGYQDKPSVVQLDRDVTQLKRRFEAARSLDVERDALKEFAKNDPEVTRFFVERGKR